MGRRVVIVGGVAGGASAAARLRRLDESVAIVLFDRGPYVSFANCGLPYHVGNVIPDESRLLLASPGLFRDRFNIDVHTEHEALRIDRAARVVTVRDLRTGETRDEPYDTLVLAPGAAPIRPDVPGTDLPGVFTVRNIPDTRKIRGWLTEHPGATAVVVGGGFIGLEMAENLHHRGLAVTLLEKLDQVMPAVDAEMAVPVAAHLRKAGVTLRLGEGFTGITRAGDRLAVHTDHGDTVVTDLVILALGVRPENALARDAGLAVGPRGGVVVDASMRTSDPDVYAVGDVIEVHDVVSGQEVVLPLAGPANRQGRVAGEAIAGRRDAVFRGVQGTAIVGVLGMTVASTGASEKGLNRAGATGWEVVYLHPGHHAGYYPGARPIHIKLVFSRADGRILGAQAVGEEGVDKRIDVIATMIQMKGTVHDLAAVELCYAPQFGAAKDPLNVAGMMAVNVLDGTMPQARWQDLAGAAGTGVTVLDVREPEEFARGAVRDAVNIPLSALRARVDEVPRDKPVWVYCAAGQRAYFAQRLLIQRGVAVKNLAGGYGTYTMLRDAGMLTGQG